MSDVYGRIHRYFVADEGGMPSTTVQLEFATSANRRDCEPPRWLVRHCEVGDALCALPGDTKPPRGPRGPQGAVVQRWRAVVLIEECVRAIRVAGTKEAELRRGGQDASDWVRIARRAEFEAQMAERAVSNLERHRDYRHGMDALVRALTES